MSKLLYDDLEKAFFPEILKEMYSLVKNEGKPLTSLGPKYGERLARLMSTRKYSYTFQEYVKWGGEALLLKLLEKSGTGRTVAAKIANPGFNAPGQRFVEQKHGLKDYEIRQINTFKDRFKRGMTLQQNIEDGVSFTHGFIPKLIIIN